MPEFDRKNVLSQRRWAICTLLFLATFLNYLDRQVLSLVSPLLRREFGLTGTSYSRIVTAFLLGYALTQLVGGRVIDKIGPRHALLAAMLWWSVAGMSVAASNSVWELGVAMLLMGVGEAACWPTAVKAIQECFQPRERAIAVGYFNSGSSVGAIVAPVIVTRLALRYSWRVAFITCGLIGLFWLIPWSVLYKSPRLVPHRTHDGFEKKRGISLDVLIRDLRVWGVVLARLFGDSIWFFYAFWLPDYLSRVRGFSMSLIGLTAWIPFLMGGVGNLMGGWISGLLIRRGMSAANARLSVILVSNAIMSMGIAVGFCNGPIGAIILISFVVFACCSWAVNILTLPSDLFAPDAVATTVGFSGAAAGLGGMLTTLLAGKVIDHYSYKFVFLGLGLLPICSGLCSLLTLIPKRSADPTPSTDWDGLTPAVED